MSDNAFPVELRKKLEAGRIIAALVVDNADDAAPLAKTLLDNGVDIMELTLRTPAALDALRAIRREVTGMTAGIGTILNPDQAEAAKSAGAAFGVAPGFNPKIAAKAREIGLPFAPGVCSPSEIEAAVEMGYDILKFFPAETCGGVKGLAAMAAPYAHLKLKYIPLGGLTRDNFATYLKNPNVVAVGGSWIATCEEISRRDWATIGAKAARAREIVKAITRGEL